MEILITGIGGMVGTHLTDRLWSAGIKPHGMYFNSTVPMSEIDGKCVPHECDVRDFLHVYRLMDRSGPM
jgi:GDP-D-mannose dehydratase